MAAQPGQRVFHEGEIPLECAGQRLDQALAGLLPDYSRSKIKEWIKSGGILLEGRKPRPRDAVNGGEHWVVDVQLERQVGVEAQPLPLDIVFEDDHLLVINKPAGLVVHPGAGNPDATLQNALLHHCSSLSDVPRAGLVHRLDKDTTGLLVVAKTLAAHTSLVAQLAERTVKREYEAICAGVMTAGGTIDVPIGRHPVDRKRQAVRQSGGRHAVTHYRVIEKFRAHTHVAVQLETGRTHQIRVHLAHQRYPIVGDPVYGRRVLLPKGASEETIHALQEFRRQALHARRLTLEHPASGETVSWEAPLPADMQRLVDVLHADAQGEKS
ncbi:MAG: 23S rRNA pseudouridine(1911/1915/1917) synthase RluD [Gammaproteobacteria bacterium]|nr:23S rRNA pseudouridine(1911/1915/1917) synthase RluD [Gammaproteobacteria bacterium]